MPDKDFPKPASYEQSYVKNEAWSNVTTTRIDPDGTKTQTSYIHPLRGRSKP